MKKLLTQTIFIILLCFFSLTVFAVPANAQDLNISQVRWVKRDIAVFKISIKNAPNAVQSFAFDLYFDPALLEYDEYKEGTLTEHLDFFKCVQIKSGILRCGGFSPTADYIPKGRAGDLVFIYFKIKDCQNTMLNLKGLVDDIKEWDAGSVRYCCLFFSF